jgi:O-acetyl-ADP-ribose deacetylase (regulator of RNase III)
MMLLLILPMKIYNLGRGCRSIRNKGGEEIQKECNKIGPIYVGGAVLTAAGKLKARYIIHAVGTQAGDGEEEIKL